MTNKQWAAAVAVAKDKAKETGYKVYVYMDGSLHNQAPEGDGMGAKIYNDLAFEVWPGGRVVDFRGIFTT